MGTPLNPPNFATGSNGVTFSIKGSHGKKSGTVDRLFNSTGNYDPNEVKGIFIPTAGAAASAGSCSFAGGSGLDLSALAADTFLELPNITQVSSSTVEVLVFKH